MQNRVMLFWKTVIVIFMVLLFQFPINVIKNYTQDNLLNDAQIIILSTNSIEDKKDDRIIQQQIGQNVSINSKEKINYYQTNLLILDNAILFISFALFCLILFDIFIGYRVTLLQYLLIGVGLVIFYLLTLALSETLTFTGAYFVSATLGSLLFFFHLANSLSNIPLGLCYGSCLFILYSLAFYFIVISGSVFLFLTLGITLLFCAILYLAHSAKKTPSEKTEGGATKIS